MPRWQRHPGTEMAEIGPGISRASAAGAPGHRRVRRREPPAEARNPLKTLARQKALCYGTVQIVFDLGARGGRQCCGTEMEMRPIPAGLLPPLRRCVPRGTGAAA